MLTGFFKEQHFTLVFIRRIREKQQNTFFLINTRLIKDIAVLRKRQCAIGGNGIDVIRVEYRNAVGFHLRDKLSAVFYKKSAVNLMVLHFLNLLKIYS